MISALITGISGTNTGTQILNAMLRLPERYRLVGTDIQPHCYGSLKLESFHVVPPAKSPEYIQVILDLCRKERIDFIIPGSEPELKVVSKNQQVFLDNGIEPIVNNSRTIDMCTNKYELVKFLNENNLPYPKTIILETDRDREEVVSEILEQLRFPLILKPYLDSGGSNNLFLVQSEEELSFYVGFFRKNEKIPMIVQEYEGSPDEEYTVGVMSDASGRAFSCFVLKRLINSTISIKTRTPNLCRDRIKTDYLTISSGVSQGWVIESDEIRDFAIGLADRVGSTGPLNIQCRRTDKGIIVFEINPRFSGTTSIRALCGHNDPDIIIQNRLGRLPSQQVPYKTGLVVRSLENSFLEGIAPESKQKLQPASKDVNNESTYPA